jgi:TPR repeat protein
MQVEGRNYLVPTDAKLQKPGDLSLDAIDLQVVLDQMESRRRVNLIFLDACRNNPLARGFASVLGATRSVNVRQGLSEMQAAVGTMIVFSTEPDKVALDGAGRNSPFTEALLRHIRDPGVDVSIMVRDVRKDVLISTDGAQLPWDHSPLTDAVVLAPSQQTEVKAAATNQTLDEVKRRADAQYGRNNRVAALELYRDAAEGGNAPAENNLGAMYRDGVTVQQDYKEATRWFDAAANQSEPDAQANFGEMYRRGLGVGQDFAKARFWYLKASDQGSAEAQYGLGILYESGLGVSKDTAEAARWYLKAANQGYAWAQASVGNLYRHGDGVSRDYEVAKNWYKKAADQGNAEGQNGLGLLFEFGEGFDRDYQSALHWFALAADQGYDWAQANLGEMYRQGNGVAKNYEMAKSPSGNILNRGNHL